MPLPRMSTVKPSFKASKNNNDEECINVLNQEFRPSEPNKVWVSDFTYIKTSKGFRYLCVIMDLFSRKIIAWKLSNRMNSTLILDVFYDAYNVRKPQGNLLFHSDRGSQYRSFKVRKVMDEYNVVQSFSKKSYPWDNAVIESFFKYLKHEETNRRSFLETEDCQKCLFTYINGFYNPFRPHSYNDWLSPDEKELEFNQLVS